MRKALGAIDWHPAGRLAAPDMHAHANLSSIKNSKKSGDGPEHISGKINK